jgi:hypothetical protein
MIFLYRVKDQFSHPQKATGRIMAERHCSPVSDRLEILIKSLAYYTEIHTSDPNNFSEYGISLEREMLDETVCVVDDKDMP